MLLKGMVTSIKERKLYSEILWSGGRDVYDIPVSLLGLHITQIIWLVF